MGKHQLRPEQWISTYGDMLLSYAYARVNDRELAKDLVQESFLVAFRSKEQYRGELSEKNWLYLVLRSRILDHFKKKSEVAFSNMGPEPEDDEVHFTERGHWKKGAAPEQWNADRLAVSNEFYSALHDCKGQLSDKQNAAFTLKYLEQKDSEDICKELNISASNYWVLIHRAKLALQDCLRGKEVT